LVDGYCEAGLMNEALALMENSWKTGVKPDIVSYNTLLKALCKTGDLVKAESLFNEIFCFQRDEESGQLKNYAVETRGELRNLRPTLATYSTLISAYCKHRGIEESRSLYEQMIMNGIMPDLVACNSMLYGLCRHGELT